MDQITFSGPQSLRQGQEVLYVTERTVFRLTAVGVALVEIAPGIDLPCDMLQRMEFEHVMSGAPVLINAVHFAEVDRHVR